MCSIKKMFLKNSQYPQKTPMSEPLFYKVAGLRPISKKSFLQNTSGQLLLLVSQTKIFKCLCHNW